MNALSDFTEKYDAAVSLLTARGAPSVDHSGDGLLAHLVATCDLLQSWGNSEDICLAGLCHAVYGTDGFECALLDLNERDLVQEIIGSDAERFAYLYASCDRKTFYPTIARGPVKFRDRFTDTVYEPSEEMVRACLELTLANDVEIARREEAFLKYLQPHHSEFFVRSKAFISEAGFKDFCEVYGVREEASSAE